jgi:hypothetical protein
MTEKEIRTELLEALRRLGAKRITIEGDKVQADFEDSVDPFYPLQPNPIYPGPFIPWDPPQVVMYMASPAENPGKWGKEPAPWTITTTTSGSSDEK